MPGERIVISGTFLVDSESRMKGAAPEASAAPEAPAATVLDPVCGMHVDPKETRAAGRTATHGKDVYFFCSDSCRRQFVADPPRFARPKP
jgi:YHS domain-containing protein